MVNYPSKANKDMPIVAQWHYVRLTPPLTCNTRTAPRHAERHKLVTTSFDGQDRRANKHANNVRLTPPFTRSTPTVPTHAKRHKLVYIFCRAVGRANKHVNSCNRDTNNNIYTGHSSLSLIPLIPCCMEWTNLRYQAKH